MLRTASGNANDLPPPMGGVPMTYYACILTNWNNKVMYIGMTNDLERRLYEHRHHLADGFTNQYNVNKLAYYESTTDVKAAIAREKQLKGWLRAKKNALVQRMNPTRQDLSKDWNS
jgi:putative endonuclease